MSPAKRESERASGRVRNEPPAAVGAAVGIGVLRCSVTLDIVSCAGVASSGRPRPALDWPKPRKTLILSTLAGNG